MAVSVDPSCLYTETHEWVRVDGETAFAGITDYAQDQLSDIVFVEMPEVGDEFGKSDVYAVVESVKAASDCYLPVSGEVIETNEELEATPEVVNASPYEQGWFVKIALSDPDELEGLMSPADYQAYADKAEAEGSH